jgi:hypothetical protein
MQVWRRSPDGRNAPRSRADVLRIIEELLVRDDAERLRALETELVLQNCDPDSIDATLDGLSDMLARERAIQIAQLRREWPMHGPSPLR